MNRTAKLLLMFCAICNTSPGYGDTTTISLQPKIDDISQTVLQMPLLPGVTPDQAVTAMINKAADLNMPVISHQKISLQLHQQGIKSRHLEILQLCTPENAAAAIELNLHFAAYIPCRVTLVGDKNGQVWILMQNIDIRINNKLMNPASVEFAIRINQNLLSIVTAGINGMAP